MQPESNSENTQSNTDSSWSKLSRLIDQYHLDELGNQLEEYWLAGSDKRYSLRELAEYVNQQLLRTVMHSASMEPLEGEVENTYRLLTADDVSTGTRTQTRRRLERADIDVEALEADFISRQAVHTYLTKDRGVSYTSNTEDPVSKEITNIQRLKRRMTTILESKIKRLRDAGRITLGEFNLLIDIRVLCEDCGGQYPVTELLDKGSCDCSQDSR
jgi:hypothetical protein